MMDHSISKLEILCSPSRDSCTGCSSHFKEAFLGMVKGDFQKNRLSELQQAHYSELAHFGVMEMVQDTAIDVSG